MSARRLRILLTALAAAIASTMPAGAANTPCSGAKGGIKACMGGKFLCNDGTTSASKKTCAGHGEHDGADIRPPPRRTPQPQRQ